VVVAARLVDPAAFGRVAVASIVMLVAGTIFGEGLRVPLVQRRQLERAHVEAAMLIALAGGLALTVFVGLAAPLTTVLLDQETADLVRLASLAFVLAGPTAVGQALLLRRLAFRTVALVDIVTAVVTAAATVVLAVLGLDATALLLGPIAGQAATAAVLLAITSVPWPHWRRRQLGQLLSFGTPSMASGIVGVVSRNVDYVVLASRMDAATVGFYWRGYATGVEYQRKVSAILQKLALPLYSRSGAIEQKRRLRSQLVRMQSLVIFPIVTSLIVLAPVVVPLVFGPAWEPAVVPTQILAVAGLINAVETGIGPLLLALGRPGALLRWNVGNLIAFGAVAYLAAPLGLVAVCVAVVGFRAIRFGVSLSLIVRRVAGIPAREIWSDVAPPACSSAALLAAGFGLTAGTRGAGWPDAVWAVTFSVVALPLYLLCLGLAFPRAYAQIGDIVRGLMPGAVGRHRWFIGLARLASSGRR
jgi:O-antigen/teichoic acid export membrane protein